MSMSKATMIRRVARKGSFSESNKAIAEKVKEEYGTQVGANQIIEVLGPERDRKTMGPSYKLQLERAKKLLRVAGNKRQAVNLINLALEAESNATLNIETSGGTR